MSRVSLARARLRIEALLTLVYLGSSCLRAHPLLGWSLRPLGRSLDIPGPGGLETKHSDPYSLCGERVWSTWEGEPSSVVLVGKDRDRGHVSREVTRRCAWQARRSRRMVALLTSVAPIKPRGSPPGLRVLPPRLRVLSLHHQSPTSLAPILPLPSNSLLPCSPCCSYRRNEPRVQIQHLSSALRGPRPPRPPSPIDHRRGVAAAW